MASRWVGGLPRTLFGRRVVLIYTVRKLYAPILIRSIGIRDGLLRPYVLRGWFGVDISRVFMGGEAFYGSQMLLG